METRVNEVKWVSYIEEVKHEISGIAALLCILAEYVEKGDSALEGDEIMSLSAHLFSIRNDMERKVQEATA